ncbi:hypothetical protein Tco_1189923 [Tanacetum coccineum]
MASSSSSEQQPKKLTLASNVNFECKDGIINFKNGIDLLESEADSTMNTITLSLSNFDKPLSFNLDEFSTVIYLKLNENCVSLPPKETVKANLAIMGLIDENTTSISSSDLGNSSPLKMRYFLPIWRVLMQYIVKCLGGM